jgi:anti-sigma factor RsiW
MTHIDEDRLLAYALEVLESDSEREEISTHLAGCPECRARLGNVQKDIEIIGSLRPYRRVLAVPNPKARRLTVYSLLKAAALVVFGVCIGFGASSLVRQEPTAVVPSYFVLSPPDDCLSGCAVSDATAASLR